MKNEIYTTEDGYKVTKKSYTELYFEQKAKEEKAKDKPKQKKKEAE